MTAAMRSTLIAIGLIFVACALYYRVRSQLTREPLDRSREGWPLMAAIRLAGLFTLGTSAAWLANPANFTWATLPMPHALRWLGVAGFAASVAWLLWMFHTLGLNLTDTVVTRRQATFVHHGPYRYVRNPMYTGLLAIGISFGLAAGTWLIPLGALVTFTLLARRTRIEEHYLIARFGQPYRDYMATVGRFIPKKA